MAIKNCFESRANFSDNLGQLLVGWYLDPDCPERAQKAEVVDYNFIDGNDDEDDPSALAEIEVKTYLREKMPELEELTKANNKGSDVPKFVFEYLGRGIDRQNGEIKPTNLLGRTEFDEVKIGSKKYEISKGLEVIGTGSFTVNSFTFDSLKDMTEATSASQSVQLLLPMIKTLNLKLQGWESSNEEKEEQKIICCQIEKSLAKFQIDDPDIVLNRCPKFKEGLIHLVESEETEKKFKNFFERWGTHVVTEQEVGGGIYIFCRVSSSISKMTQATLELQFKTLFQNGSAKIGTKFGPTIESLKKLGMSNEQIIIKGGTVENFVLNFASLTPEILQQWHTSVDEKPASIIGQVKCFPDYQLVHNNEKKRDVLQSYTEKHITVDNTPQLEPTTQLAIANDMKYSALKNSEEIAEKSCFPPGTYVYVGSSKNSGVKRTCIETLNNYDKLQTVDIDLMGGSQSKLDGVEVFQHLKPRSTIVCTFLHKAPRMMVNYMRITFANGQHLTASKNHLIVLIVNGRMHATRAVNISIGDLAIFLRPLEDNNVKQTIELIKCVHISRVSCVGAYAPLTCSGTFFANGFLVTCYAEVDSFNLAHLSMTPLRLWCFSTNLCKNRKKKSQQEENCVAITKRCANENKVHPYAAFLIKIRNVGDKLVEKSNLRGVV
ncbi:unnamed protein product [Orchesella dallaii]|uniref:MACPF domain-containing protein n=1 Tax=Orchesella dallaii TaxID=48710 RepID=A0ABP1RJ41_9HEXA